MLTCQRAHELIWDAMLSGLWAALGAVFIKIAVFNDQDMFYGWFKANGFWMVYIYDAVMIALMLVANTISIKYKMLSFKTNGAFMGYTVVFVFQWIFSVPLDYLLEGSFPHWNQFLGAPLLMAGVCIMCYEHEHHKDQDKGYDPVIDVKPLPKLEGDKSPAKISATDRPKEVEI